MFKKGNTYGVKHGKRNTRLYCIWVSMKQRCYNHNNKDFRKYGERGIKVCDDWKNNFISFYDWSINNGYQENLTIDRINNNEDYEPNNCRWTDVKTQSNNRRTNIMLEYRGKRQSLTQWANEYNINPSTFNDRLERGWTMEQALTISTKGMYRKHFNNKED